MLKQYVYLIESNGFHKIGMTTSIPKRMKGLQTSSATEIVPVSCYLAAGSAREAEGKLHKIFADIRMKGEWFDFTGKSPEALIDGLSESVGLTKIPLFEALQEEKKEIKDDTPVDKYAHLYTPLPNVNFKIQEGVSWLVHRDWVAPL